MPRKFKCAVTVPGDNSVDIYSQDLSLVVLPMTKKELEDLTSLPVADWGTHNKEETFTAG